MVKHAQCKGVADVEKFLKSSRLPLSRVQIVSVAGKFGSTYMVFYDTDDLGDTNGQDNPIGVQRNKAEEGNI